MEVWRLVCFRKIGGLRASIIGPGSLFASFAGSHRADTIQAALLLEPAKLATEARRFHRALDRQE